MHIYIQRREKLATLFNKYCICLFNRNVLRGGRACHEQQHRKAKKFNVCLMLLDWKSLQLFFDRNWGSLYHRMETKLPPMETYLWKSFLTAEHSWTLQGTIRIFRGIMTGLVKHSCPWKSLIFLAVSHHLSSGRRKQEWWTPICTDQHAWQKSTDRPLSLFFF